MKKITKVLGILVLLIIGTLAFYWGRQASRPELGVELSKQIYNKGEEVRITVRNNSMKRVCFSSCYPYRLQVKKNDWQPYNYRDCPEENLNIPCVDSGEVKEFEFALEDNIKTGLHRIAIPIDKEAVAGEKFEEDKKVYSEPFDVK